MLTHVRRAALREKFGKRSWSAGGQKECLYMCLFYKPGIRFTAIIGGGSGRPRECSLRLGTIAPATETGLARFPEKRPLRMWCRRSLRVTVGGVKNNICNKPFYVFSYHRCWKLVVADRWVTGGGKRDLMLAVLTSRKEYNRDLVK